MKDYKNMKTKEDMPPLWVVVLFSVLAVCAFVGFLFIPMVFK